MRSNRPVTQEFLDSAQYQTDSILCYEQVYGADFVSPGGRQMAAEMIGRLKLAPGARVLDVGCGLGGSAFVMAREFGLQVDGLDLSRNMLAIANDKLLAHGLSDRVSLRWGDCLQLDCERYYDAVYSRDVFLHIHDKPRLFSRLYRALRRGGQLLFTDYCAGPRPWRDDFSAYVKSRGYRLHDLEAYAELIAAAGFNAVTGVDMSARFIEILQADLTIIDGLKLAGGQRDQLRHSWTQKLARAQSGDHRWGLFTAIREQFDE